MKKVATTLNNLKCYLKKTSACDIHPQQSKVLFRKNQLLKTTLNNLNFYFKNIGL